MQSMSSEMAKNRSSSSPAGLLSMRISSRGQRGAADIDRLGNLRLCHGFASRGRVSTEGIIGFIEGGLELREGGLILQIRRAAPLQVHRFLAGWRRPRPWERDSRADSGI